MKQVFRKSALDKIASVDQLDKTLRVTSPMSWLALLGVTVILVAAVIWSVTGTLPSTITASGILVEAGVSANTVLATEWGTVQEVIGTGERVYLDTPVIRQQSGEKSVLVTAGQIGYVTEVLVAPGSTVSNGTELVRVRPYMSAEQKHCVVAYVPVSDADKVERGMEVHITLTAANSSIYGNMTGRVVNVDTWATSTDAMAAVMGKDNSMTVEVTGSGKAVKAVTCEIYPDPATRSGYLWSSEKGREKDVTAPQMCSVRIITENLPPITKLFSRLRDIWENKQ